MDWGQILGSLGQAFSSMGQGGGGMAPPPPQGMAPLDLSFLNALQQPGIEDLLARYDREPRQNMPNYLTGGMSNGLF